MIYIQYPQQPNKIEIIDRGGDDVCITSRDPKYRVCRLLKDNITPCGCRNVNALKSTGNCPCAPNETVPIVLVSEEEL